MHCRRGTTLIEVLAGLVILGTLLVSIAAARSRFQRQWSQADRRVAAVRATDSMLADWLAGAPQNISTHGSGPLPGMPDCTWRTRVIAARGAADVQAVVVRLEVFDRGTGGSGEAMFNVDFLLHDFRKPPVSATPGLGAK